MSLAPRWIMRAPVALAGLSLVVAGGCSAVLPNVQASDTVGKSMSTSAKQIEVTLTETGGVAILRATYAPDPNRPDRRGASAFVTVPSGAVLVLRTSNGAVTASGLSGTVLADTSNAEIAVSGGLEALRARSSNGRIAVDGGIGLITLETSNAAIDVKATAATIQAATSNGAITFAGSLADGTSRLETSNAAISVALPRDASFSIDAQTSNAKIATDFPVLGGSASDDRLTGTVGASGGATLILKTSNGDIRVVAGS